MSVRNDILQTFIVLKKARLKAVDDFFLCHTFRINKQEKTIDKKNTRQNKPSGRIAMNKEMLLKIFFFMMIFFFCSYFSGVAFAGICDENSTSGGVQTFSGNFTVPPEWRAIKWAPNNPEVINRNETLAVNVINGTYPYSWSVSGNGFSLDPDQTQAKGLSNKLTAGDTACGAATINVIDSAGSSTNGYVRCTAGSWVYNFTIDPIPAGWDGGWVNCCGYQGCWLPGYCGNGGIQGYYYFDPKHRAVRCIGVLCGDNCPDLTAKSYTFNDGFTVTHYRMTLEGSVFDGHTHGCTRFNKICGHETYGQSWECN